MSTFMSCLLPFMPSHLWRFARRVRVRVHAFIGFRFGRALGLD